MSKREDFLLRMGVDPSDPLNQNLLKLQITKPEPALTTPGVPSIPPGVQLKADPLSRITPPPSGLLQPQPGMRAQTPLDQFRNLRDWLGQRIAPVLGLDWQQLAEAEAQGQRQAIMPIDPSVLEDVAKGVKGITKRAAETKAPPFPQYGEEYMPVPEEVMKTQKKVPKKPLTEKQLAKLSPAERRQYKKEGFYIHRFPGRPETPEIESFNKALREADEAMAREGYKPTFDPAKRTHVDPAEAHYSKPEEYEMPTTRGKIDETKVKADREMVGLIGNKNPGARARLQAAFDKGLEAGSFEKPGSHAGWYKVRQLYDAFIKELGPTKGRAAFKEWGEAMGATTAGATPTENLRRAQFARFMKQKGLQIPTRGADLPAPLRGMELGGEMKLFKKAVGEGKGLTAEQPKRMSFLADFLGFTDYPTIDKQMTQIITPGEDAPPGKSYFAYAELVREMAAKNKMPVDEFQAIVWGGHKAMKGPYQGKSMIEIVNEAIERTARITGKSPQEVLKRGIIRAEIPVYGILGAVGVGAAAEGLPQNRQEALDRLNQGRQ